MSQAKKRRVPRPVMVLGMLLLLLVLAVAALGIWYLSRVRAEQAKMTPLPTSQTIPGIYAVNDGFVNFYLIRGETGYLMIDAGNNADASLGEMASLGVDPSEISAVFLTHSDGDHTGGLSLLPEDVPVYLPQLEEQMVDGTTNRSPLGGNRLSRGYTTLQEGAAISVDGIQVESIGMPGHTPGHTAYLVDGASLFVGDGMSLVDGRVALFNSFFNMDDDQQAASIGWLAARETPDFLFTMHYGYTENPAYALEHWAP